MRRDRSVVFTSRISPSREKGNVISAGFADHAMRKKSSIARKENDMAPQHLPQFLSLDNQDVARQDGGEHAVAEGPNPDATRELQCLRN